MPTNCVDKKINVIIDTDAGADDLIALMLALRSDRLRVKGVISSYGSFHESQAFSRLQMLFKYLEVPTSTFLIRGSEKPLTREFVKGPAVHGSHSGGAVSLSTSHESAFTDQIRSHILSSEKVFYISLGPLTNFKKICDVLGTGWVEKIVIMGGALQQPGNVTSKAEANFFWDPEAVQRVFATNLKIDLIPLDVTENIQLDMDQVYKLKEAKFIAQFFLPYFHYYTKVKKYHFNRIKKAKVAYQGASLHDAIAVLSVIDPSLLTFRSARIQIDRLIMDRGYIYEHKFNWQLCRWWSKGKKVRVAEKITEYKFWIIFNCLIRSSGSQFSMIKSSNG